MGVAPSCLPPLTPWNTGVWRVQPQQGRRLAPSCSAAKASGLCTRRSRGSRGEAPPRAGGCHPLAPPPLPLARPPRDTHRGGRLGWGPPRHGARCPAGVRRLGRRPAPPTPSPPPRPPPHPWRRPCAPTPSRAKRLRRRGARRRRPWGGGRAAGGTSAEVPGGQRRPALTVSQAPPFWPRWGGAEVRLGSGHAAGPSPVPPLPAARLPRAVAVFLSATRSLFSRLTGGAAATRQTHPHSARKGRLRGRRRAVSTRALSPGRARGGHELSAARDCLRGVLPDNTRPHRRIRALPVAAERRAVGTRFPKPHTLCRRRRERVWQTPRPYTPRRASERHQSRETGQRIGRRRGVSDSIFASPAVELALGGGVRLRIPGRSAPTPAGGAPHARVAYPLAQDQTPTSDVSPPDRPKVLLDLPPTVDGLTRHRSHPQAKTTRLLLPLRARIPLYRHHVSPGRLKGGRASPPPPRVQKRRGGTPLGTLRPRQPWMTFR